MKKHADITKLLIVLALICAISLYSINESFIGPVAYGRPTRPSIPVVVKPAPAPAPAPVPVPAPAPAPAPAIITSQPAPVAAAPVSTMTQAQIEAIALAKANAVVDETIARMGIAGNQMLVDMVRKQILATELPNQRNAAIAAAQAATAAQAQAQTKAAAAAAEQAKYDAATKAIENENARQAQLAAQSKAARQAALDQQIIQQYGRQTFDRLKAEGRLNTVNASYYN